MDKVINVGCQAQYYVDCNFQHDPEKGPKNNRRTVETRIEPAETRRQNFNRATITNVDTVVDRID